MAKPAKCGATKKDGTTCGLVRGFGTEHKNSGRCKYHGGASPNGVKSAARAQVMAMADEKDAEPHEVLLKTIRVAWGAAVWLQQQVTAMDPEEEGKTTLFIAYQQLYGEWTERAAKFSKMALDAGVAERSVRIQEQQGELLAAVIRTILAGLSLTPAQQAKAPQLVRGALLALEA